MEGDQDLTLRNLESKASLYPSATSAETKAGTNGHGVEHSRASQEDLFLVLAKLDSFNENNLEPSTKSERRRVSRPLRAEAYSIMGHGKGLRSQPVEFTHPPSDRTQSIYAIAYFLVAYNNANFYL